MKKLIIKHIAPFIAGVSALAALVFLLFSGTIGREAGRELGETAGSLMGVSEGVIYGQQSYEEGKAEGLSAKDTKAEIEKSLISLGENGRLEVYIATVRLKDEYTAGGDAKKYQAINLYFGNAVFTVDLNETEVAGNADEAITVYLPEPKIEPNNLNIDYAATKTIASKKSFFDGGSKEGYLGRLNADKQMIEKARTEIEKELSEPARAAAENRVTMLAKAAVGNACKVSVRFRDKEADGV